MRDIKNIKCPICNTKAFRFHDMYVIQWSTIKGPDYLDEVKSVLKCSACQERIIISMGYIATKTDDTNQLNSRNALSLRSTT